MHEKTCVTPIVQAQPQSAAARAFGHVVRGLHEPQPPARLFPTGASAHEL